MHGVEAGNVSMRRTAAGLVWLAATLALPSWAANVPTGYTKCATEGSTCTYSGSRLVSFGAGGKYVYGIYQGSVACTLANFGGVDPNPAVTTKVCARANTAISMTSPVPAYRGVSLAGAEFAADMWGNGVFPGTDGIHYTYPTPAELNYFAAKKMNTVRIPFRWERLQPTLSAAFDAAEWTRLNTVVTTATAAGLNVVLDPHNYARWSTGVVGASVPNTAFANLWSRLASAYATNPKVIFGLMNEPHDMPTEQWLAAANAALAAIRATGSTNKVFVPGNAWSVPSAWSDNWYGSSNATVMTGLVDPGNNMAFEVHQYLNYDSSGSTSDCVSATIGVERLTNFTAWLRSHGQQAFLGETAGANNPTCQAAVQQMMNFLNANRDVWIGWSWWAAGPWWGDYMFSIEPRADGSDAPQMSWLTPYLP